MRVQCGMNCVYGSYTLADARRMRAEVALVPSHAMPARVQEDGSIVEPLRVVTKSGTVVQIDPTTGASYETHRVTRKERRQRSTAMRPCMQWNRGDGVKCSNDPCRFAHTCMLCNGDHRALECEHNKGTEAILKQAAEKSQHGTLLPLKGMEKEDDQKSREDKPSTSRSSHSMQTNLLYIGTAAFAGVLGFLALTRVWKKNSK